jgi:uncharacterized protein YndB with AHSA1/START domain
MTEIVVEEVLPHAPESVWKALTTGELVDRWLMKSTGFAAVKGTRFTFQTAPLGAWDGVVQCEVLDVVPNQRLSYSWRGGHDENQHYGSRLDTVVTWTLAAVEGGTTLRLVHAGFVLPANDTAYRAMGEGWKKVLGKIAALLPC